MSNATFTAARVQGRYRVLDEAGEIVVTLNSKAKAEARAAELNAAAAVVAEAESMVEIDAALEVLDGATDEAAQDSEDYAASDARQAEAAEALAADPEFTAVVEEARAADAEAYARQVEEAPEESVAEIVARQDAEEAQVLAEEEVPNLSPEWQAEMDAASAARLAKKSEEEETPAAAEKPAKAPKAKKPAKPAAPKADQPAPHAFTTVGTTIKNHCASCGRSWAAASHRKYRAQQAEAVAPVETEEEWTPAEDDTTASGEAPALDGQTVAV